MPAALCRRLLLALTGQPTVAVWIHQFCPGTQAFGLPDACEVSVVRLTCQESNRNESGDGLDLGSGVVALISVTFPLNEAAFAAVDSQTQTLAQAQAAAIDQFERGAVTAQTDVSEQIMHLLAAQD